MGDREGQLSSSGGGAETGLDRQLEQISVIPPALQKKPEDTNRRSADMWSFAVLLWELVTREVPFADLSNMEIGMKVRAHVGAVTVVVTIVKGWAFPTVVQIYSHPVLMAGGLSLHRTHVLRPTLFFPAFTGGTGRPSAYHPTRHFSPCV